MIRKLRRKVIGLNMLLVTVVLVLVFLGVFAAARRSIADRSSETLHQALAADSVVATQPALPTFTADVLPSGTVRVSGSSYYNLEDEQVLLNIVKDCLEQEENTGVLRDHHLRYYRQTGIYTRIAFMDSSFEQDTLRSILATSAAVGVAALVVLFICSYLLSGLVTRPVAHAWDSQRQFLSDAGHELKTPLTVILTSAELMEDSPYTDNIQAEGRKMKALIEDMLTLSRDENLPTARFTQVELSRVVTAGVLHFEPVAFEAGHVLNYDITQDITLMGDEDKLGVLVGVLLDNAIKYAAPGSPIRLTLLREAKVARLVVENQGIPIPPEQLKHLFDRFYRADNSRSGTEGFGLGLSIARSAAQIHQGKLWCKSDEESTKFICTLPI